MHSYEEEKPGISWFLAYWMLFSLGSIFVNNGFKFIVYDLSGSDKLVSLVGSASGAAFMILGLFAGIIVSATSNRFFIYLHLVTFTLLSVFIYLLFHFGLLRVEVVFLFIILSGISSSLHSAAGNRIFYDLCGTGRLSLWLSIRNILVSLGSAFALILLNFLVEKSALLFLAYAAVLLVSLLIFYLTGYQDTNKTRSFNSGKEILSYVFAAFLDFIRFSGKNRTVGTLFLLSFMKTFFIYWAMYAGVLLKLGIDDAQMRRTYLFILIFMEGISVISLYFVGKKYSFTNRDFLYGAMVSALGIFLFASLDNLYFAIAALSLMYVGFAICQIASGYILRTALPERFRTQGISFAVIPYYCADIFSGIFFAALLGFFDTRQLLFLSGGGLLLMCFLCLPFISTHILSADDEA